MTVNEFLVSAYLYTYTILSDNTLSYPGLQDVAGLIQVSIVLFAVLINAIFSLGSIARHIFKSVKKMCLTKKMQEA